MTKCAAFSAKDKEVVLLAPVPSWAVAVVNAKGEVVGHPALSQGAASASSLPEPQVPSCIWGVRIYRSSHSAISQDSADRGEGAFLLTGVAGQC